jgi:predicted amidohydrolase
MERESENASVVMFGPNTTSPGWHPNRSAPRPAAPPRPPRPPPPGGGGPPAAPAPRAAGADLLICPEMFLAGYNIGAEAAARFAEPADGPSLKEAAAIARRYGTALLFGYPERGEDEAVYNAVQLIGRDGRVVANYRKCHLFGALDRGMFHPGRALGPVAELDGLRVGLLICYDVEFPESVRLLALRGADLIAVPTALMTAFEVVARILIPARAVENQVFVAYANRCGRDDGACHDLRRNGPPYLLCWSFFNCSSKTTHGSSSSTR